MHVNGRHQFVKAHGPTYDAPGSGTATNDCCSGASYIQEAMHPEAMERASL